LVTKYIFSCSVGGPTYSKRIASTSIFSKVTTRKKIFRYQYLAIK